MTMLRLMLTVLSVAVALAATANESRLVSPVDFLESPILSGSSLSPDGTRLIYLDTRVDWVDNTLFTRVRVRDVASGKLQNGPMPDAPGERVKSAKWRPDGAGFALRVKRGEDTADQLYFYTLADGELTRLTHHATAVESFVWSADSESLYFVAAALRPTAQQQLVDGDWLVPAYDDHANRHIWRLDVASGNVELLVGGEFSVRQLSRTRDGRYLLYARVPSHELDRRHEGDIWALNLVTGERQLWTQNDYTEYAAALSPDGEKLAYIASVNEQGQPYYERKVFVGQRGTRVQRLLGDKPMEALALAWDASGDGLFILANIGVTTQLYHYRLQDAQLRQITTGEHDLSQWRYDPVQDVHIAKRATAGSPGDIGMIDADTGAFEMLTTDAQDWSVSFDLPVQQAVRWRGKRGVSIEGLLVYPVGYATGESYPLVTIVHGGPRSSSRFGAWNRSRYVSVLASQGYAVLLPNHRGGTGYGDAFMRDMYGRYFRHAHHDVLDGVQAMVKRGVADPDRLIAMGWSAGGHMVNKLITMTDQFAAASSGAGASDWLSMVGESDVRRNRARVFGGMPWQRSTPLKNFRRDSPLLDAWRVTTPTLFFTGERDVRVPPTQSIMMYRGVRAAGAPTALYVADGQPHNYRRPSFQLFKINRELAWYAEHALNETYEAVLPAVASQPAEMSPPAGE